MCPFDGTFADKVAEAVNNHYTKLPKKGKPQAKKEWTLLSAVVLHDELKESLEVIALATGSKCIGKSKMSPRGDVLNDSHAEVLARRAALRYLYEELGKVYSGQASPVLSAPDDGRNNCCSVREGITFHFFSSHTPCGDASIFPKVTDVGNATSTPFIGNDNDDADTSIKKPEGESVGEEILSGGDRFPETRQGYDCELCDHPSDMPTSIGHVCDSKNQQSLCSQHCCQLKTHARHVDQKRKRYRDLKDDQGDEGNIGETTAKCAKLSKHVEEISGTYPHIGNVSDAVQTADIYGVPRNTSLTDQNRESDGEDIHRTGAKCVPGGVQDPREPARGYHTTGALRTKPGRGERTQSMSCSDKMARWNLLGFQGALLALFLTEPLYFSTIIVGKCPYSEEALRRAVCSRIASCSDSLPPPFTFNQPTLLQAASYEFIASKRSILSQVTTMADSQDCSGEKQIDIKINGCRIVPSPSAIVWYSSSNSNVSSHDVVVNGRCQGVTKSDLNQPHARSMVCSISLFQCFQKLLAQTQSHNAISPPPALCHEDVKHMSYHSVKSLAIKYQSVWSGLRDSVFHTWIQKSRELLGFCVDP